MEIKFNENEIINIEKKEDIAMLLSNKFSVIEAQEKIVNSMYVSAKIFKMLRSLPVEVYSEATYREMKEGVFGYIWTADIIVSSKLDGNIILSSEEYARNKSITRRKQWKKKKL